MNKVYHLPLSQYFSATNTLYLHLLNFSILSMTISNCMRIYYIVFVMLHSIWRKIFINGTPLTPNLLYI